MALEEITEQSTSDEISEYADQVVKEVEAERAGEKGDAQITAEHADNEHREIKPTVEKKSDAGEESAEKEDDSRDWLDDDLKGEVAAYGIEEAELADFASREELERAMRLFDKSALTAGRKALAEDGEKASGRNAKGQFEKKTEPAAKAEEKSTVKDGNDQLSERFRAEYDDVIVGVIDKIHERYEPLINRLEALEARIVEADARAEEQGFDSAIDKLDMPKLFGTTGKESAEELKRREEVMVQARVLQAGYRSFGKNVEIPSLVGRAAPMVFSSDFEKQKLKNHTRKITRQSNSRQGGGATRPQDPREDPRDAADRLYREMAGLK